MVKKSIITLKRVFFQPVFNFLFGNKEIVTFYYSVWRSEAKELLKTKLPTTACRSLKEFTQGLVLAQVEVLGYGLFVGEGVYFEESVVRGIDESQIPVLQVAFVLNHGTVNDLYCVAVEVENFKSFIDELFWLEDVGVESVYALLHVAVLESDD